MQGDGPARAITDFVSRFGTRRDSSGLPRATGGRARGSSGPIFPTRALPGFLASLRRRTAPVVLDLGPVVGANVTFLGEQLGCKLFVEDLFADIDRPPRKSATAFSTAALLRTRLTQEDASVDGVLCWDLLDYLEPEAGRLLARELVRLLRPGGVLLVCFGTESRPGSGQTKYEIIDEASLRYRSGAEARGKRRVLQSRELTKMFEGLIIADSFLLTNRMREMLFRKRSVATGTD